MICLRLLVKMASFDLGFHVEAHTEISSEDADILNDIFFPRHWLWGDCYVYIYFRGTARTRKGILWRQKRKFCTPQKEISQKRFKSVIESELKELMEKRQSKAPQKVQIEVSNSFKVWFKNSPKNNYSIREN